MQPKQQKKKAVTEILNKVVTNALYNKPEDIAPHIIQVLQDIKGVAPCHLSKDERKELAMLKEELKTLNRQPQITIEKENKLCFDQSDSDEDDEEELDLPTIEVDGKKCLYDEDGDYAGIKNLILSEDATPVGTYDKETKEVTFLEFEEE